MGRVPSWVYDKRFAKGKENTSKGSGSAVSSNRAAVKNALGALPSVVVRPDKDGRSYIAWNKPPGGEGGVAGGSTVPNQPPSESTSDDIDIDFRDAADIENLTKDDSEYIFDDELPDAPDDVGYWKAPRSAAGLQPLNAHGRNSALV